MKTSRLALPANPCGALRHRVLTLARFPGRSCFASINIVWKCLIGTFLLALPSGAGIVSWNPNPEFGISRYEVSYGTSPGVHDTTINAGLNTSATLTGLVGGQTYYIVVKAVNQAGLLSPPSAEVSFQAPNTNPANQAPVAQGGIASTNEDTPVWVTVSASDPENDPLTYHMVSGPAKGSVTVEGPRFTYIPDADAHGQDSFTYRVRDGSLYSNTATVNISVNPVNDAPVAANRTASTPEDVAVGIALSGSDKDNDPLTYHIVAGPAHGTLGGTGAGVTYTPNTDFHGTDTFTYYVNDGFLNSNTATVSVVIHPTNDAPVADDKSLITNEDVAAVITLSGSDKDNDPLTYQILAGPAKGTLSGTGAGRTYTPNADANGSDSFTYRAFDGFLNSSTATVTITVLPVNDAPVAANKSISTHDHVAVAITLAAADKDSDPLTYQIIDSPSHGSLSGEAPDLVYLPDTDFLGDDSFTFRVNDGVVDSELATVSIRVKKDLSETDFELLPTSAWSLKHVDSEEFAGYPATQAFDGSSSTFWHTAFTSNATPPPHEIQIDLGDVCLVHGFRYLPRQDKYLIGNISSYQFQASLDGKTWGTPVAEGTFANDQEEKEVRFTAKRARYIRLVALGEANGAMHTSIAELGVLGTIAGNGAPTADALSAHSDSAKPVAVNLIGTDPDGDALFYEIVKSPAKGKLSGTAPKLIYTPIAGAGGADSFTYRTGDGVSFSSVATVSLSITPANRRPVAQAVSRNTVAAAPVSVTLSGSDEDGDGIVFRILKNPSHGKLTGTAPNLIYTPAAGFTGTDQFIYLANDGTADSDPVYASIHVARRNSPPVVGPKSYMTNSGSEVAIVLPATDADGDSLTYVIVTAPENGKLTGVPPSMIYQPAAGFEGADTFRFTASDGRGISQAATIRIVVKGKNTTGPNQDPTFKFSPVTRVAGMEKKRYKAASLANTATDPDKGDKLRFSKISGPKWLNIASNGNLSGMPPADSAGMNRFKIAVTDGKGGKAETLLLIDIAPVGLPLPWEVDYIGKSGRAGKAAHQAGTFSLSQAGGLGGNEDTVSFVWQTLSGDGQIIARVAGLKNGHAASRAGVMIRESLAPKSRHVFLGVNGKSGVRSVTRKQGGDHSITNSHGAGKTPKIWVKMARKGDIIRSYKSANGRKWILTSTRKVGFNKNCYIGLAVSGGGDETSTGMFRNVKVRP